MTRLTRSTFAFSRNLGLRTTPAKLLALEHIPESLINLHLEVFLLRLAEPRVGLQPRKTGVCGCHGGEEYLARQRVG